MRNRFRNSLMVAMISLAAISAPAAAQTPTAEREPPTRRDSTYIDPRRIAADPETYAFDLDDPDADYYNIYLRGEVANVRHYPAEDVTWLILEAQVQESPLTEPLVVMLPLASNILRGDQLCIYGVPLGTDEVVYPITGGSADMPLIAGYDAKAMVGPNTGICPKT